MNKDSRASKLSAMCLIAVVGLLTAIAASAQEPLTEESTSVEPEAVANQSDLIARVHDCDVLTVSGDDFDAIFTVSGQVVSSDGSPVEGAFVVLRESSTTRISREFEKYAYAKDRQVTRVPDVFARTTTDREGKFEFREVKSPALPRAPQSYWSGDVVAAHRDLGVGWLALGNKNEKRRVESDLTIVLRPTGTISGRYVSPDSRAIENGVVAIYRLVKPTRFTQLGSDLDLQMSQLAPRAQTDSQGRFTMTGIPPGLVAVASITHRDWMLSSAAIATSDDVAPGQREGEYLHDQEVMSIPAEIIADPGLLISGQVVDSQGEPVPDVRVSYSSTVSRMQTDPEGKFRLRLSSKWLDRDRKRGTTSKFYVYAEPETGFLSSQQDESIDDLVALKPITITLEKGVVISGKVLTDEGDPVPDATLRPVSDSMLLGAKTEADGSYELMVPAGKHLILVGVDEPGYTLPQRREIFRSRIPEDAEKFPHLIVDVSDGIAKQVPPLVVSKVKTLQVIASLPDGKPAAGATAMVKDQEPLRSVNNGVFSLPPRVIDKSTAVLTNRLGRADLLPLGVPTEKAFVEVKLATGDQAYDGSVPLTQAVDGVLIVLLKSAWIVEGRVLIDGEPVVGAKVSIGESTPNNRTINGRTFRGSTVSNFVHVVTDQKGLYRAAVSPGKEYSVSLQSLPNDEAHPGFVYRPTAAGEGRLTVKDFAFRRGDQELAGRVIDADGKAVVGAQVQVMRQRDVEPSFWVGHQSESQHETDQRGRFHLKRMPPGTYQLTVRGPRGEGLRRAASTMVTAKTGNMDLEVILNPQPQTEIPRLQPKRIEPIQPSAGEQP